MSPEMKYSENNTLAKSFRGGECSFCSKVFGFGVSFSTIRHHEKICSHNPDKRIWRCELCDKIFPHGSGLFKHRKSVAHLQKGGLPPKARKKIIMPIIGVTDVTAVTAVTAVTVVTAVTAVTAAGSLPPVVRNFPSKDFPLLNGMDAGEYSVILADPPFQYSRSTGSGVAENHYHTMRDGSLDDLQVSRLAADSAMLFMWCSGPTMGRAINLCEKWGFKYKTVAFVWVKTGVSGQPQSMGLGSYTRPGAEYLLLAGKGKITRLMVKRPDQVFLSQRRSHSEKPLRVRDMIDTMVGKTCKKIELFCRTGGEGDWAAWGDELGMKPKT